MLLSVSSGEPFEPDDPWGTIESGVAVGGGSVSEPSGIIWDPSPNYNGRGGTDIDSVVIHTTEGSFSGALAWMKNPESQVSAHYLIGQNGEIRRLVADSNRAWHATYYNSRSIGIEMAGFAHDPATWNSTNLGRLADLVAWLVQQYDVPLVHPGGTAYDYPNDTYNAAGIVAHAQIQPWNRSDPGPYFNWSQFMADVSARLTPNTAPTAANNSYTTAEDVPLVINAPGVLANDTDPEGNPLTAQLVAGPANGSVTLNGNGSFTYTPNADFSGSDSFTYRANDGIANSNTATVSLTVTAVEDVYAAADAYRVTEDQSLVVSPPAGTTRGVVIGRGSTWRYHDFGQELFTAWRDTDYDDAAWRTGAAPLGYGDGDEATVIESRYDDDNRIAAAFFRRTLTVPDAAAVTAASITLRRDDAAAVFINGQQVYRDSQLPVGADITTLATGSNGDDAEVTFSINPSVLVGGTNVIAVQVHQNSRSSSDLSFDLRVQLDTGGGSQTALPFGFTWRYWDKPTDPGATWMAAGYDDSAWSSGAGELGYGDGDEATVINYATPAGQQFITTYFRRDFDVTNAAMHESLELRLWRDDAAAVYLNGVEIARDNLAANASAMDTAIATAADDGRTMRTYSIALADLPPGTLREGRNVLAVEVHQASHTSSDVRFDAELLVYGGVQSLLDNDATENGSALAAELATPPANGQAAVNADGSFTYTPNANFFGIDTFTYIARGMGVSGVASSPTTVTITVDPTPDAPTANSDVYYTAEDGRLVAGRAAATTQTLIAPGTAWRYLDNGSDQGTAWRALGFDDAGWAQGLAELGYGDGDEATVVGFGGNTSNRHITTYFRRSFTLAAPDDVTQLVLDLLRDDGAAVYINGVEIARSNLAPAAGYNTPADTAAAGDDETAYHRFVIDVADLPAGTLLPGRNIMAVEVHQSGPTSSDLSFNLGLSAVIGRPGVTSNDLDPDGEAIIAALHDRPAHGRATLDHDGAIVYVPHANFFGVDTLTYLVPDGPGVTLLPAGSTWRYLDADPGTLQAAGSDWVNPAFDDSAWPLGPAQLGYGDGDEATVIGFGGDAQMKHPAAYFRTQFDLPDPAAHQYLVIGLMRDDAARVYLNGIEVYRDEHLSPDADHDDDADEVVRLEDAFVYFTVDASLWAAGQNTLAVAVHQAEATSTDLSFDLQVLGYGAAASATVTIHVAATPDVPTAADDAYSTDAGEPLTVAAAQGVTANDIAWDGQSLLVMPPTTPANGNVTLNANGSFTYTPDPGYTGADSFTYRLLDPTQHELITFGSTWRYLDTGADPGGAWRDATFNDAAWTSGQGEFGYGDDDEATTVGYGPSESNRYATTWFRKTLSLPEGAGAAELTATLLRDDAAAVYLNGVEVFRDANLPPGAAHNTYATGLHPAGDNAVTTFSINPALLTGGVNVFAVEVHQASPDSSDLSFDLRLTGRLISNPAVVAITVIGPTAPAGDVNGDGLVDAGDIDALYANLGSLDPRFDLNATAGPADLDDVHHLVTAILQTQFGDANLDRRVNITDLSIVATHFGSAAAGWANGNFNGDGVTNITDLSIVATRFGFDNSGTGGAATADVLDEAARRRETVVAVAPRMDGTATNNTTAAWRHIRDTLDL